MIPPSSHSLRSTEFKGEVHDCVSRETLQCLSFGMWQLWRKTDGHVLEVRPRTQKT